MDNDTTKPASGPPQLPTAHDDTSASMAHSATSSDSKPVDIPTSVVKDGLVPVKDHETEKHIEAVKKEEPTTTSASHTHLPTAHAPVPVVAHAEPEKQVAHTPVTHTEPPKEVVVHSSTSHAPESVKPIMAADEPIKPTPIATEQLVVPPPPAAPPKVEPPHTAVNEPTHDAPEPKPASPTISSDAKPVPVTASPSLSAPAGAASAHGSESSSPSEPVKESVSAVDPVSAPSQPVPVTVSAAGALPPSPPIPAAEQHTTKAEHKAEGAHHVHPGLVSVLVLACMAFLFGLLLFLSSRCIGPDLGGLLPSFGCTSATEINDQGLLLLEEGVDGTIIPTSETEDLEF